MEVKIFQCDYDFQSEDETMLPLSSGDEVEVLHADDLDWWYGKLIKTSQEGWFPPSYGHLILTTSLLNTLTNHITSTFSFPPSSTEDLYQSRSLILKEFLEEEERFIEKLKVFIDKVIVPIEYQDNSFKRIILSDSSIALSFSLYTKIWNLCHTFYSSLFQEVLISNQSLEMIPFSSSPKMRNNSDQLNISKICLCFTQFAPSLRLFSQYISENSNVLNSVKSHGKSFNLFLEEIQMPIDTSIESFLTLPVEHYSRYLSCIDKLLYLTTGLLVEKQKEEIDGLNSLRVNCDSLGPNFSMIESDEHESMARAENERGLQDLREAVEILQTYTNEVDEKLMSESRKHILLAVETQFINHPKIFNPDREYITEGELELVQLDSNSTPKLYHAHLFNDALVLSKRITGFTGKFKFARAIDLCVVTLKSVPSVQITNSFCLESIYLSEEANSPSVSYSYIFNCRTKSGLEWWVKNINLQLTKLSQRHEEKIQQREQKRNSMIRIARRASANWSKNALSSQQQFDTDDLVCSPAHLSSPSRVSSEQLNQVRLSVRDATTRIDTLNNPNIFHPRVQYILKYLANEFQFQKKLVDFYQVVIEPLINTSKGADLQVGLTDTEKDDINMTRKGSDGMLFERRGSYLGVLDSFTGKKQTQQISELILDSNFQIFLFAIENITYSLIEFLLLFELSLMNVKYNDESVILGTACFSSQAVTLFQLFLSYASSYHTALRIFSSNLLMKFKQLVEEKLCSSTAIDIRPDSISPTNVIPGATTSSLNSFLIYILHFPERLKVFLIKLHDMTPISHSDHLSLDHAIASLTKVIRQMNEEYTAHINFEKLISIQNSFFLTLFQPELYLKNLVSNQRIFIREGDLIKVCRKTNQLYRFWLFSDAIIYGKYYNSTRKYKLHRVIELTSICNVQPYSMRNGTERQFALIINSLEKSFILIAASQDERNSWINDLNISWNKVMKRMSTNSIRNRLSQSSETSVTSEDIEPAPVWVPDSMTSICSICQVVINGVTIRRHHCRKCGQMVCSKHSSKRILLPNIHKTQPQRVCDGCAVVIEERNSLRLTGSLRLEVSSTPTKIEESSSGLEEGDEEEEDNSREAYTSRRFSMKSFKGFTPTALPSKAPTSSSLPRVGDSPSVSDTKRKEQILSQLLSQNLQGDDLISRPLSRQPEERSTSASRPKIIPAYSVPISFMLTHDSVKSRKSFLATRESREITEGGNLIELSTFSIESQRGQSQDFRPSLSKGRPSFLSSALSTRSLGEGERGLTKSLQDNGLLHMLTAVLTDDRELLMQSDDEEDERDSISEGEDEVD